MGVLSRLFLCIYRPSHRSRDRAAEKKYVRLENRRRLRSFVFHATPTPIFQSRPPPRASRSGNREEKKEKALTLGGLKADQLRVLALTSAVKGPHPGVVKRVEVQPVYRANGLAATVHLLRIRFQTGHL